MTTIILGDCYPVSTAQVQFTTSRPQSAKLVTKVKWQTMIVCE